MKFSFSFADRSIDLPPKICEYLRDVERLIASKIGAENVVSIILFGSYARQDFTDNSDVDLLIILSDEFYKRKSRAYFKRLEELSLAIELKHDLKIKRTGVITAILNVVEKTTGMFVSHFICRKSDWEKQIFFKIFGVNSFLSTLIAPGDIVLKNMSQSHLFLYGKEQLPRIKKIKLTQIIKSLIMTELIAVGSIFIFPLWRNVVKYSLEAFKWSVRNSFLYLSDRHASMGRIREFFTKTAVSERYFDEFLSLRNQFKRKFWFTARCPIQIFKIYVAAIKYRKMFADESE